MIIADVFFLLFTGFLIVALAGPSWGSRVVADYRRGIDLVLAFDLSRSMNARDCPPSSASAGNSAGTGEDSSRLERGLEIGRAFAAAAGDTRLGIALGKGRGILAVPLTYDHETVLGLLHGLDDGAISGRGTNLESLINAASEAFRDSTPHRRGIVLFSDGEALSGSFQAAAEKARRAGISLCAVGLGSDQGALVPVERSPAAPDGFLPAADGKPVISARQGDVLRYGAERTGGVYVDGSRNDAARLLGNYVSSLSSESRVSGHRREPNPRWQIFVLAAMVCLAVTRIMGFSRRRAAKQTRLLMQANLLTISLCLIILGSCEIGRAHV
jgi:Ca-activated chloride channel family protein